MIRKAFKTNYFVRSGYKIMKHTSGPSPKLYNCLVLGVMWPGDIGNLKGEFFIGDT